MRPRYEPRPPAPQKGAESPRDRKDDRDASSEYPGQFGGEYDDAERRFARNAYVRGERDTGAWDVRGSDGRGYGERGQRLGARDWERREAARQGYGGRDYGEPDYAGQGYGERHYGEGHDGGGPEEQGAQRYGGRDHARGDGASDRGPGYRRSESGALSYQDPSRDRWEPADRPGARGNGVAGGPSITVDDRPEGAAEGSADGVSNRIRVHSGEDRNEGSQNAFANRDSIGENAKRTH